MFQPSTVSHLRQLGKAPIAIQCRCSHVPGQMLRDYLERVVEAPCVSRIHYRFARRLRGPASGNLDAVGQLHQLTCGWRF